MARRSTLVTVLGAMFLVAALSLTTTQTASAQDMTKVLMKKGDKLFNNRAAKGKAEQAKQAYQEVLAVDTKNVEARWKLSRILYWIGRHTSGDQAQMKVFEEGIRYAQEAIQLDDKCYHCHFWLGVSYGKFGEAKGILNSLGLVPHVEKAMKRVIALGQERYEQGGPYRVLGRLGHKVPGGENGLKELKKSIELGDTVKDGKIVKSNLMNYRFLAELYVDDGQKDKAKEALTFVLEADKSMFPAGRAPDMREEQDEAKAIWKKQGFGDLPSPKAGK